MKQLKKNKWLFLAPRILGILFSIFISMFALDVFGEYGFPEILVALFMHLIPTFVLIIILIIAWKKEKLGGILFIVLGIGYPIMTKGRMDFITYLIIPGPLFLTGILFILNSKNKK